MMSSRLIRTSVRATVNSSACDHICYRTFSSTRGLSSDNKDWTSQTVEAISGEEVSFSENRKHKMDGDTCYYQELNSDSYEKMKQTEAITNKQDERLSVYQPCSVGLSGVMQTNVPEPFDSCESTNPDQFIFRHSANLNMPGGAISLKAKYVSGQLNGLDVSQSRH